MMPCGIVGRCANYILKNRPNTISIFLYADMPHKISRAVAEYGIPAAKAPDIIASTDKSRSDHYFHYTGLQWGDSRNYHITFDTGIIPIAQVTEIIRNLLQKEINESNQS